MADNRRVFNMLKRIFQTFRRGDTAKHTIGKAMDMGDSPQQALQGTADQFMSRGVGFGGKTMFPYRSGIASSYDRQGRVTQYIEQDFDPYANNALDIIADFVCDEDEEGNVLTVNCENEKIKNVLESLYYDVINIEAKIWPLARGLAKFGDYFCMINWHPNHGVMDLLQLPVHEIEREEGFDEYDPMAVRFKWTTHPHRRIQNFEMLHFRLFGNDALLPYGTCAYKYDKVLLKDGIKEIQHVKKGDVVISFDEDTQEKVEAKVLDVVCNGKKKTKTIRTRHNFINVTPEHRVAIQLYADDVFTYKTADELEIGDRLVISREHHEQARKHDVKNRLTNDFIIEPIEAIEDGPEDDVYDIYVDHKDHNIFANGVLVHNSVLEASRRPFQQYLMMFDAMMIYRMVRAPERLVFNIEVGNTHPDDVDQFLADQKDKLTTATAVDSINGIMDKRYDPMNVTENYWIAKRGDQQSTIDQLPGGTVQGDVEDIEVAIGRYIAGLKVPKPYLDYSEEWAKANIANMDIRFSKTIRRIQNAMKSELTKVGLIHLMSLGIEGNDLFEWDLEMSNPSTIAELQKLEMWEKRLNIVTAAKGTEILDDDFIYDNILTFSDAETAGVRRGLIKDAVNVQLREKVAENFAERLANEEEPAEGEAEGGEEEGGGGEGPPASKNLEVRGESKQKYGIPQSRKADLGLPDTEEELKRSMPNDGDGVDDPYDEDFFHKTATNLSEGDPDAMEESRWFALETEGKIISESAKPKIRLKTSYGNRQMDLMKEQMDVRAQEIYEHEGHDPEVIMEDMEDDEQIVLED